jgi:hypothetical protein
MTNLNATGLGLCGDQCGGHKRGIDVGWRLPTGPAKRDAVAPELQASSGHRASRQECIKWLILSNIQLSMLKSWHSLRLGSGPSANGPAGPQDSFSANAFEPQMIHFPGSFDHRAD